jgi:hypothetical protein
VFALMSQLKLPTLFIALIPILDVPIALQRAGGCRDDMSWPLPLHRLPQVPHLRVLGFILVMR